MEANQTVDLKELSAELAKLKARIADIDPALEASPAMRRRFVDRAGELAVALNAARELLSPVIVGKIDVTLGNPKSIAKFFTFNFISQPRLPLAAVVERRFYGAGVYAIYYEGKGEKAYQPLSGTETPIYVGKADPDEAYAETTEKQGEVLGKVPAHTFWKKVPAHTFCVFYGKV